MKTLVESSRLRYFCFFYLYVMQGVPGAFALIAITNYLSGRRMDAASIAAFGAVVGLPWAFKFIWGPFVDRFQNAQMGRRRPWIIGAQLGALAASSILIFVKDPVSEFSALTAAFVVHGIFASLQDISVDALAITVVPDDQRGRANAFMKIGMISGQAIGAAGLAIVISKTGFRDAALIQFFILGAFTLLTIVVREVPGDAYFSWKIKESVSTDRIMFPLPVVIGKLIKTILSSKSLSLFSAIAAVFICERLFQRILNLHLIQRLGWTDTDVSVLTGTYGTMSAVVVALGGGWLSDRIGAVRTLQIVTLLMGAAFLGFSLAGVHWSLPEFASGGLIMRQVFESLFSIAALPVLMGICSKEIAAAQFGFYMALSNQADVLGIYLSGKLFDKFHAPVIGISCALAIIAATLWVLIWGQKHAVQFKDPDIAYNEMV